MCQGPEVDVCLVHPAGVVECVDNEPERAKNKERPLFRVPSSKSARSIFERKVIQMLRGPLK